VTIVIDVGCARYGGDFSVERLIDMYRPNMLIGYDPNPAVDGTYPQPGPAHGCVVYLRQEAAWIWDGEVRYQEDGLNSWVSDDVLAPMVPCVDLARVVMDMPDGPVILKIDAEKSEYALLPHLIERRADRRLDRLIVEWHCLRCGRGGGTHRPDCPQPDPIERERIERSLVCPVEEWNW
jgi:hypothetical protein